MNHITTIKIPALKGDKLIKDSKLFGWIDPDFVSYGANKKGGKTKAQNLNVLEIVQNGTFKDIFNEPNKMVLTQEQILYFIKNHKDKLRQNCYATFFLFKSGDDFFVADVYVDSYGELGVDVRRFEVSYVWYAVDRRRVVVPQLVKPLEPETLDGEIIELKGEKYKLVKI
jgi:hypothetical protein